MGLELARERHDLGRAACDVPRHLDRPLTRGIDVAT